MESTKKIGISYYKGTYIENCCAINDMFVCYKHKFPAGYLFKGESHTFYEMAVILDGSAKFTVRENVYKLTAGQTIFLKPGWIHAMYDEDGASPEMVVISFSASNFPNIKTVYQMSGEDIKEVLDIYDLIYEYFDVVTLESVLGIEEDPERSYSALVKRIKSGEMLGASLTVKRLETFILKIASAELTPKDSQSNGERDYYEQILATMETHISEKMTCARLANRCNISVSLMEKTMHKHLGCGTIKYFNMLKMQKALLLLEQGISVKEVGERLGFYSQSYFSSCFKRHFSYSPVHVKRECVNPGVGK